MKPPRIDTSTDAVQVALRRVRLLAALLLFMQLSSDRSGGAASFVPATLVAALVVSINVLSLAAARVKQARLASVLGALELSSDAVLTVFIVTFMDFLNGDVIWAVLVIPVLEGALRYRVRGAVITWAGVSTAYLARELSTFGGRADLALQADYLARLQTLVHRMGVVLLVAVPAGYLSEQLIRAISAQRQARQDATARGQLLELVVEAGKQVNRLDGGVYEAVTQGCAVLGFDVVDVVELDSRSEEWSTATRWSVDHHSVLPHVDDSRSALELAITSGVTAISDHADDDPGVVASMAASGLAEVAVAALRGVQGSTAAVRVGVACGRSISAHQVECLELLAGQAVVAVANSRLVGQLQSAHEQLEHQAFHDALTGLPNRALMQRRLDEVLAARSTTGRTSVAVLFLDLDRFKEVNDTLGHEVGDELLVAVSKRLRGCVRDGDLVARLGGDEFTILLKAVRGEHRPTVLAERICQVMAQPFRVGGHEVSVSSSVGIALADPTADAGEVMRQADLAMYTAKAGGRSQWAMYSPGLDGDSRSRIQLEAELRHALERNELTLAYQPVATTGDGTVIGMEALLRWPGTGGRVIGPDEFIPLAEDSGLIIELGRWVLVKACAQMREWLDAFPDQRLTLSVNVSPRQLTRPAFLTELERILESSGVPADRLVLEITERVFAGSETRSMLDAIRALGVRVAIDDFGQGQASMSYLHRFSVDILKIDKAYVQAGDATPQQAAILKSIIGLAHDLQMQVVAEGVETVAQLNRLRGLSCDAIQGYLFQPPLAVDQMSAMLDGRKGPSSRAFNALPVASAKRTQGRGRRAPAV
jgi:diguanylate cyclase (GGDEF)-like protein